MMKKLIKIIILTFIFINIIFCTFAQSSGNRNILYSKSYYLNIFKQDEISNLVLNTKNYWKYDEYYNNYLKFKKEYTDYHKKEKSSPKKLKNKYLKNGFEALSGYFKINSEIQKIYASSIKRNYNDNAKFINKIKICETQKKQYYSLYIENKSNLRHLSEDEKLKKLLLARIYQDSIIRKQELILMLLSEDISIEHLIPSEFIISSTSEYCPQIDTALVYLNSEQIISKLNITEDEKTNFKNTIAEKNKLTDKLVQLELLNLDIDSLRKEASQVKNLKERESIEQSAQEKEMKLFTKININTLKLINLYSEIYKLLTKYYDKIETKNKEINFYKKQAEFFYADAIKLSKKKDFMFIHLTYIYRMQAYNKMLTCLQLQENVFADFLSIKKQNVYYCGYKIAPNNASYVSINSGKIIKTSKCVKKNSKPAKIPKTDENLSEAYIKTYNINDNTLKDIKYPKGIIFKLQLGYYKQKPSAAQFGKIQPVVIEKKNNDPRFMIYIGEFCTNEAAEFALNIMQKKGFKYAEISAYNNGKIIPYKSAKQKLDKNDNYLNIKDKELHNLGYKKETKQETEQEAKQETETETETETGIESSKAKNSTFFALQLGTYKLASYSQIEKQYSPIKEKYGLYFLKKDDVYIYYTAKTQKYDELKNLKQNIKNMGFDSFVIAIKNEEKISINEAENLLK